MSFGLTNAPTVFQRLMQRLLNPASGPDFMAVYINDVLMFSPPLKVHFTHLQADFKRINGQVLFVLEEVEHLSHLVTPQGLNPNFKLVEAASQFPRPTDVSEVRRFLGPIVILLAFHNTARIAEPLRELTQKNASFRWTQACEDAISQLKGRLTSTSFPSFDKPFRMETDASISVLGAFLSQKLAHSGICQ